MKNALFVLVCLVFISCAPSKEFSGKSYSKKIYKELVKEEKELIKKYGGYSFLDSIYNTINN